jgi:major membrane immunogen (membrane-anchored lipoprotein)
MRAYKKYNFIILVVCLLLLVTACAKADPIVTDIGSFEYSQKFMPSIDDVAAAEGNTLLVIYLKPAEGTSLDLDTAEDYFFSGTQATLADTTYDLKCLSFEKVDNAYVQVGLVFEVTDNGYEKAAEQPVVQLSLPSAK